MSRIQSIGKQKEFNMSKNKSQTLQLFFYNMNLLKENSLTLKSKNEWRHSVGNDLQMTKPFLLLTMYCFNGISAFSRLRVMVRLIRQMERLFCGDYGRSTLSNWAIHHYWDKSIFKIFQNNPIKM